MFELWNSSSCHPHLFPYRGKNRGLRFWYLIWCLYIDLSNLLTVIHRFGSQVGLVRFPSSPFSKPNLWRLLRLCSSRLGLAIQLLDVGTGIPLWNGLPIWRMPALLPTWRVRQQDCSCLAPFLSTKKTADELQSSRRPWPGRPLKDCWIDLWWSPPCWIVVNKEKDAAIMKLVHPLPSY